VIDQEPLLATSSDAHELETMVATYKLADAFTPDAKRPLSSTMRVCMMRKYVNADTDYRTNMTLDLL